MSRREVRVGVATDVSIVERTSIDVAEAEVVLRRAVELASYEEAAVERFPIKSLEQVAAELHLPVTAVADALAEYRAGVIDSLPVASGPAGRRRSSAGAKGGGVLDRLIGPRSVAVRHRTGLPDDVAADHIAEWLRRAHWLRTRVTPDGTVVGVRRRGVMPALVRGVRSVGGGGGLSGVREVRGAAVTAEPGHTAICLVADLSDQRAQSVVVGSGIAVGGAAVVSTLALVTAPVTLVGVPVMVGAGWLVSLLTHRYRLARILEEVEITADNVAAGGLPSRRAVDPAKLKRLAKPPTRPAHRDNR